MTSFRDGQTWGPGISVEFPWAAAFSRTGFGLCERVHRERERDRPRYQWDTCEFPMRLESCVDFINGHTRRGELFIKALKLFNIPRGILNSLAFFISDYFSDKLPRR